MAQWTRWQRMWLTYANFPKRTVLGERILLKLLTFKTVYFAFRWNVVHVYTCRSRSFNIIHVYLSHCCVAIDDVFLRIFFFVFSIYICLFHLSVCGLCVVREIVRCASCVSCMTFHLTIPPLNKIMDHSNTALWTIPNFDLGGFLPICWETPKQVHVFAFLNSSDPDQRVPED